MCYRWPLKSHHFGGKNWKSSILNFFRLRTEKFFVHVRNRLTLNKIFYKFIDFFFDRLNDWIFNWCHCPLINCTCWYIYTLTYSDNKKNWNVFQCLCPCPCHIEIPKPLKTQPWQCKWSSDIFPINFWFIKQKNMKDCLTYFFFKKKIIKKRVDCSKSSNYLIIYMLYTN